MIKNRICLSQILVISALTLVAGFDLSAEATAGDTSLSSIEVGTPIRITLLNPPTLEGDYWDFLQDSLLLAVGGAVTAMHPSRATAPFSVVSSYPGNLFRFL